MILQLAQMVVQHSKFSLHSMEQHQWIVISRSLNVGMELFCNIQTNAINLNRDLRWAMISISSFRQDVECLKKIKQCFNFSEIYYNTCVDFFKLSIN